MTEVKRTCATCAVSFVVEPPRIATKLDTPITARPVRICRLNPPQLVPTASGQPMLTQGPVMDEHVCWHWKPPGTLPGDSSPVPLKI